MSIFWHMKMSALLRVSVWLYYLLWLIIGRYTYISVLQSKSFWKRYNKSILTAAMIHATCWTGPAGRNSARNQWWWQQQQRRSYCSWGALRSWLIRAIILSAGWGDTNMPYHLDIKHMYTCVCMLQLLNCPWPQWPPRSNWYRTAHGAAMGLQ